MKFILIWITVFLILFGGFFFFTHIYYSGNPKKYAIFIDTSAPMESEQETVVAKLKEFSNSRYSLFCMVDGSTQPTPWKKKPVLKKPAYYGPRNLNQEILNRILEFKEIKEAQKIFFITNIDDISILKNIKNIQIIRLKPYTP